MDDRYGFVLGFFCVVLLLNGRTTAGQEYTSTERASENVQGDNILYSNLTALDLMEVTPLLEERAGGELLDREFVGHCPARCKTCQCGACNSGQVACIYWCSHWNWCHWYPAYKKTDCSGCKLVLDPCASSPCLNGGACTKTGTERLEQFECKCPAGWMGETCQTYCGDDSACTNFVKSKSTLCEMPSIQKTCPTLCKYSLKENNKCYHKSGPECGDEFKCKNDGICKDIDEVGTCTCRKGYSGKHCEKIPSPNYDAKCCSKKGVDQKCLGMCMGPQASASTYSVATNTPNFCDKFKKDIKECLDNIVPGCINTDGGATDVDGDACPKYSKEACGLYDDDDFKSKKMCCVCGGGNEVQRVDGQWGDWGSWARMGNMPMKIRSRRCNNPPPKDGGLDCVGSVMDYVPCNEKTCPSA